MNSNKMSLANLPGKISRSEMKHIMAGSAPSACGEVNTYCGSAAKVTCCSGLVCEDAGNAQNPNIPGGDKICA